MTYPRISRDPRRLLGALLLLMTVPYAGQHWPHRRVDGLLQTRSRAESVRFESRAERDAWRARYREFCDLWIARHERDVTAGLAKLAQTPGPPVLRERAVRALGRLETPAAGRSLNLLLAQSGKPGTKAGHTAAASVPPETMKLALARLRTRGQAPRLRVDALARAAGVQPTDLRPLSRRLNDPTHPETGRSFGRDVFDEVLDVLYTTRRQGHDIRAVASGLALSPAQQVLLRSAGLPPDAEVRLILDYEAQLAIVRGDDLTLAYRHLVGLGPRAHALLGQYLDGILRQPRQAQQQGAITLLRTAALTGDSRLLPVLRRHNHHPDSRLAGEAQDAVRRLEQRRAYPILP